MTYTIKTISLFEDTLNTEVVYTFDDGTQISTVVSHFQPLSKADVLANIEARGVSEQQKILAVKRNLQIKQELEEQYGNTKRYINQAT